MVRIQHGPPPAASPSSSLAQDTGLSRRQHRFKSGWGRHINYLFSIINSVAAPPQKAVPRLSPAYFPSELTVLFSPLRFRNTDIFLPVIPSICPERRLSGLPRSVKAPLSLAPDNRGRGDSYAYSIRGWVMNRPAPRGRSAAINPVRPLATFGIIDFLPVEAPGGGNPSGISLFSGKWNKGITDGPDLGEVVSPHQKPPQDQDASPSACRFLENFLRASGSR